MKKVNLLEDPSPAVGRDLVDDFDGVLHLSVDVDAGLDGGVGPLAQHLARQTVQLVECVGGQGGRAGGLLLLLPPRLGFLLPSCQGSD